MESASEYDSQEDRLSVIDSEASQDSLDVLLQHYRFHFEPDLRVKWKKRLHQVSCTASFCRRWSGSCYWRLAVKPEGDSKFGWFCSRILVVPETKCMAISTPKLKLGFFRLLLDLKYDLRQKKAGIDYRVFTEFSDGPRLKTKFTLQPAPGVLLRAKHFLDWRAPVLTGTISIDPGEDKHVGNPYGSMDFSIQQLDLCFEVP